MRSIRLALVVPCLLLGLAACGGNEGSHANATSGGHAAEGVVPGSYEDWCSEHAVPESRCTRCNPKLVPAFKATNDWCAEHSVPESQCLVCHPDLKIARPPKTAGG
jgi:hypothetical protein